MYFVMHSTVTNLFLRRLYNITNNLSIIFKTNHYENFKQQSIIRNFRRNKK